MGDIVVCVDVLQHVKDPSVILSHLFDATKRICIIGTWVHHDENAGDDWLSEKAAFTPAKVSLIHKWVNRGVFESKLREYQWKVLESGYESTDEYVVLLEKSV